MKKTVALLGMMFLFAFGFTGYALAQDETDQTGSQEEYYVPEENPAEPVDVGDTTDMFSDEAVEETGSMAEEYGETEEAETEDAEADTAADEIVTTYDEKDTEYETEECSLWSCALYKMIVAVVGIGASAFWIFMLVDILKLDAGAFPAGREYRKWLWFAGVFFFWAIGATVYYFEIFRGRHQASVPGGEEKK
jgi:hypothetical protein